MAREPKSPQRKKQLEYTLDHVTRGKSVPGFRKAWPLKKALANRGYRRKSDELFSQAKTGLPADDAELAVGEITAAHLKKSVSRKRLSKGGPISLGKLVQFKLAKRAETAGRRVKSRQRHDIEAREAVNTLASLEGKQLVDFVMRSAKFMRGGDPVEWTRVMGSDDRVDRALAFLHKIERESTGQVEALRRNEVLCNAFREWLEKANRILAKEEAIKKRKSEQKLQAKKRVQILHGKDPR